MLDELYVSSKSVRFKKKCFSECFASKCHWKNCMALTLKNRNLKITDHFGVGGFSSLSQMWYMLINGFYFWTCIKRSPVNNGPSVADICKFDCI